MMQALRMAVKQAYAYLKNEFRDEFQVILRYFLIEFQIKFADSSVDIPSSLSVLCNLQHTVIF